MGMNSGARCARGRTGDWARNAISVSSCAISMTREIKCPGIQKEKGSWSPTAATSTRRRRGRNCIPGKQADMDHQSRLSCIFCHFKEIKTFSAELKSSFKSFNPKGNPFGKLWQSENWIIMEVYLLYNFMGFQTVYHLTLHCVFT